MEAREGFQGWQRNWSRDHRGTLLTGFLLLVCSSVFLLQSRPTCSGMEPPAVGYLPHIHRNEENASTDMAIGQSDAYTLPQLRCLLPRHVYFVSAWQEQIMTESVCYFPLEPSNISLSRLHCDPNAIIYLGPMGLPMGNSRVSTSWSKALVMSFRFLYMFLFHLRRGVDFVHLKCFRYFEGSRISFFGDCEQFEESSPCLPGL